jgi:UDP-GlcNAc:undecaprenyl-phosphate GlcNAc-1-phosphate transferase
MAIISGFLVCNIPIHSNRHAKCFMGDAGSTFVGFSVAYLGILLSQGEMASMSPVTGLWLVAVPIYDVFTSMFRRIFRGDSPFKADRYHLHHILMDSGLSAKMTLSIILLLTCMTATIGLVGEIFIVKDGIMFLSWISLGVLYYGQIVFFRGQNLINITNKIRSKAIFLRLI